MTTSYRLQVSTKSNFSGATTFSLSGTSTSASVAGLRSATRYYFRIAAINAEYSTSLTPYPVPTR